MPAYQRLGPYNQHCREDRREPAIELDKEQAVAVVEPDATPHFSLQHPQLLPERGIFGFKSDLGLDECRQQVEGQKDQCDHDPKRDVIPSPVQCGRGFRYTQPSEDDPRGRAVVRHRVENLARLRHARVDDFD
jgi:hypothetical protein